MEYVFDWDVRKAQTNARKHGVTFRRATAVFLDPRAVSMPDEEHSNDKERWVTLGLGAAGSVLVLVHTFTPLDAARCRVRIISARRATKQEMQQYNEGAE
ncbi:MAG: BrnT family toxin [Deltaproteobacteria bacterium]|nr:BrnT family toxin [Deltaproteobacteria bacterium]